MIAGDIVLLRLQQTAAVTNLVGAPPNDRIYKFWLPEKPVYPAIVYKLISDDRLRGTYSDPGYVKAVLQIVCFSKASLTEADALAEQVRLALERFGSSQPAGIPFAGATLYDIKLGSGADGYAPEAEAHFVTRDYTVHHLETTP